MSQLSHPKLTYTLVVMSIAALSSSGYLGYRVSELQKQLAAQTTTREQTASELASTITTLEGAKAEISRLEGVLAETTKELEDTTDDLREEKNKNEEFDDQIRDLAGTVGDLDKLSKIDAELLQKYSKVYFLNENYIPSDIDRIADKYVLPGKDAQFFHGEALPFLEDMLEDAKEDGIDLKVISAYRSFDHQSQLKGEYTTVYGSGANAFSADQGYSEHQLGTTLDITTPGVGGTYTSFAQTEAYKWLLDNAYRYGFVLSYPENNTFYIFEPWHWRFVGVDLARDLHRADAQFYDWEQRKIDTYLLNLFD